MGNCGSANNNKQTHVKTNQIKDKVDSKQKNNQNKNQTDSKLKSVPPSSKLEEQINKKKVKFSIKNLETNEDLLNSFFDDNSLLKDVISQINYDKNKDYDILNNNNEKLNDKLEMKIKDIFPDSNIQLNLKYSGLEIPENIQKAYSENNKLIGSSILDNPDYVGIFILNTTTDETSNFIYSNENQLRKYNSFTAFCNGKNNIFISGGENQNKGKNNNELYNDFCMIDLEKVTQNNIPIIELTNLIEARTWHSMIYVPNKYIFIIGGDDKKVYYFDTETKEINESGDLNEIHIEPALGLYQNKEIYVFSNNEDNLFVEKTDLTSKKPFWEKIEPKLDDNILKFNQKFSGVSLKGNKFIFLGGDMEKNGNEFNYEYDINKKLVKKSNIKFKKFNLKEKTFLKYNDSLDFLLTDFNKVRPEVLFFKKNKNIFKSFQFFPKILNIETNSLNRNRNNSQKFNFDMPKYDTSIQTDNANYIPNNEDKNSSYYYENNEYNEEINNQKNDVNLFLKQSNVNLQNSKINKKQKVLKNKKNNSKLKNSIKDSSLKNSKKEKNKEVDLNAYKSKQYKPKKNIDNSQYIKPLFIIDNTDNLSNPKIIKSDNNPNQIVGMREKKSD